MSTAILVAGCLHIGAEAAAGRQTLVDLGDAYANMGATAALFLGDIGGYRYSGGCPTGDWSDCPSAEEGGEWLSQLALSGIPPNSIAVLAGNHDLSPGDEPLKWWLEYIDPLAVDGAMTGAWVHSTVLGYERQFTDNGVTWRILMMSDPNVYQDVSNGGRISLGGDRADGVMLGQPSGGLLPAQLDFLRDRIEKGRLNGQPVIIATHQAPPETTAGSWAGEARQATCTGATLHGLHVTSVPGRPDLDAATSDSWGGAIVHTGSEVDPSWATNLLGSVIGHTVKVWLVAHTHPPTPDFELNGHGLSAPLGNTGVTVVHAGTMAQAWCGKVDACVPGASKLVLDGDSWSVEPWDLDHDDVFSVTSSACGSSATHATTIPGPWGNVPIVSGSGI